MGFSPDALNKVYVTPNKTSNSGNLEPMRELITFLFLKVTMKAMVVNSDS